ncbi:MAG TPA: hypothetical protein VFC42_14015 [Methylomirabilota bacterium]|jgi:hypothetical protein|nr:hypothetical protein [Methylomirabilota bacterium]
MAIRTPAGAAWPPFLPSPDTVPAEVVSTVERVWAHPTLVRTVEGVAAPVPFAVYARFIDAPDLTAAAARHLGLARYEVRMVGDRRYEADDHDGARGIYRVLVDDPGRRVILSSGRHTGTLLGTIRGHALTVLTFREDGGETRQQLTAYVLIENRVAALLARALVPVFGGLADRKLTEGFRVTAQVAEWAVRRPAEFCRWLASEPVPRAEVARVAQVVDRCQLDVAESAPAALGAAPRDRAPARADPPPASR